MTLMMGGRTAGGGSRGRPTVEGSAQDPRVRASTRAPGVMASRSWVFIRGPAGTATRAPGHRASAMALEWRAKAAGSTEGSGHRGSKVATGSWRARPAGPGTRGRGATGCRMVTALKPTLTEVRLQKLVLTVTSAPGPSHQTPVQTSDWNIWDTNWPGSKWSNLLTEPAAKIHRHTSPMWAT